MHDVGKITDNHGVETRTRDDIEKAKDVVAEQLRMCNAAAFFPDFASYLEDIAYLVVNTQQKWGTNLHTYLWRLQLPERRMLQLRRLCTYSDQVAYLVPSPSAILEDAETRTLTTILSELSDDQLVFTYHQLREVRGLFTNVVNNGMIHLYTDGHDGIWPYLFFSDGVVYIKRKSLQVAITTDLVTDFTPDIHVGMLARFFSVIFVSVLGMLEKNQDALHVQVEKAAVEYLGLTPYWLRSQTIPNKGGVEYRWFWLGACYVRDHHGIHTYDGEGNLFDVFNSALQLVIKLAGNELRKQMPLKYLNHLTRYLDSVVEVPLAMREAGGLPDFQRQDRKSTRLNSSHANISYAVFCLKKKKKTK